MIIVFNGTTLDLVKRLEQFSGNDEKVTLDFIMENFKIMKHQDNEIIQVIYNNEKANADAT